MKMGRIVVILFVAVFMISTLTTAVGGETPKSPTKPKKLKLAHFRPPSGLAHVDQWFADEIKKRTNGQVEIEIHWAEALGRIKEQPTLIASGAVDMGGIALAYYPSQFPLSGGPNAIFTCKDAKQSITIHRELVSRLPALQEEFTKQNMKVLSFSGCQPYYLISKGKIFITAQDLRGAKVRSWGEFFPIAWQKMGAVPVSITAPDMYEALDKGTVDICPFYLDGAVSYKLHEVSKHVSPFNVGAGALWNIVMNLNVWKSLPASVQSTIEQVAIEREKKFVGAAEDEEKAAIKLFESSGTVFDKASESELKRFQDLWPNMIELWQQKKGPASGSIARLWIELLKK